MQECHSCGNKNINTEKYGKFYYCESCVSRECRNFIKREFEPIAVPQSVEKNTNIDRRRN
jgi:hypothetical protein